MSNLIEKTIKVNRTVSTSSEQARAIEDPIRAKIIEILYHNILSAEQITHELKKTGFKKALTTIRHHMDILKEANLIQIVRIEETRGAITKFYSTSTKLLNFEPPKDFDSQYSVLIKNTSSKLEKLLKNISSNTSTTKKSRSEKNENYTQYLLTEILNRAMTNVLENNNPK